eukprot:TRINITY_DN91150_c0_g1_i1.p1 TRINITY_DN91150_c0_g1~~TRINITY_DN91150_c0_g1_i1.p1  ORF type:complete len:622 (-),score=130.22 TRINITY_DN91150_c0_g1_i1:154-2019(-)
MTVVGVSGHDVAGPPIPRLRCDLAQEAVEDGLSPDYLRHFCDTEDLGSVDHLEIQVDSVVHDIEALGEHLPNLQQLKLAESSVLYVRDLGTSLANLQVLWMSRCGLQDLSGVGALPVLREFYLPFNDVTDLSPLGDHEHLEVLDIEGNAVSSLEEVETLKQCPKLHELSLCGNPVCRGDTFSRRAVILLLPRLEVLDDISTTELGARSDEEVAEHGEDAVDDDSDPEVDAFLNRWRPAGEVVADAATDDAVPNGRDTPSPVPPPEAPSPNGRRPMSLNLGASGRLDLSKTRENSDDVDAENAPVEPLKSEHPLLSKGLEDSTNTPLVSARYPAEPDEFELIVERLKRARPRAAVPGHAFTARPADRTALSSFSFSITDRRRQVKTADGSGALPPFGGFAPPTPSFASRAGPSSGTDNMPAFRPPTASNSGLRLEDHLGASDSASGLTSGDVLAGNPLAAVRQRRSQELSTGGVSSATPGGDMEIRELLRRYQTYTQQSCLPPEELRNRKLEADQRRPGTSDVRIRPLTQSGLPARPGSSSSARPGSSSGREGRSGGETPKAGAPPRTGGYAGGSGVPLPPRMPSRNGIAKDSAAAVPQPTLRTSAGEALILDDGSGEELLE